MAKIASKFNLLKYTIDERRTGAPGGTAAAIAVRRDCQASDPPL
jgi:hypothetical protein